MTMPASIGAAPRRARLRPGRVDGMVGATCSRPLLGRCPRAGRGLPLLLATLLGACAVAPPAVPQRLVGRMSLQVAAHGAQGPQGFAANFELTGTDEAGELQLLTPLGMMLAQVRWAPGEARLATAEGERRFADLDALSRGAFGEPLPLAALPDWLRGQPWPRAPSVPLAPGPGFEQLGWTVDTTDAADGRIDARRPGPPEVRLRAVMDAPA